MDPRQRERIAAARELTDLMERHRSFSFVRLGDGEIFWLRHVQNGKAPPKYRYFENKPTSIEITMSTSGLEARHSRRFVEALENCSYLDYCDSNPTVRDTLHLVRFGRDPSLYRSMSAEVSNILFEWTYYEMKEYLRRHRCLIAGAEAALLRELFADPDYRRLAERFLPRDAQVVFHQVRDNGRNYSENLDLIKEDLAELARAEHVDTIFLSLATGAKIICYELARETTVRAIDFGSFSRALAYAGSPGYQTHRSLHNPFMFRVPLLTYMNATERAHPELTPAMCISKAHAQLALEVQDLQPLRFNAADTVTRRAEASRERIDGFKQEMRAYRQRYRRAIKTDPEARNLDREFTRWRRKRGIGLDGQLFVRLVKVKGLCRRAMRAAGILRRPPGPRADEASGVFVPDLYGDLVPRCVRDAIRFIVRPEYRHAVIRRRRQRRYARLREESEPKLRELSGGTVLSGPFRGLKCPPVSVGSAWAPKILGTYESELSPIIERIVSSSYHYVVDIGAAEGYYAVGLAKRMPSAKVACFEMAEDARVVLAESATANEVASRIEIHGRATPDALARVLDNAAATIIICDIEGAEVELLDPRAVPSLRGVDLLVELHDFVNADVEPIIRERFALTHGITEIRARPRRVSDCPTQLHLGRSHTLALLDEQRPDGMRWLWMCQRAESSREMFSQ